MHIKHDTPKSLAYVYVNMCFELFSLSFDRTVERMLVSRDTDQGKTRLKWIWGRFKAWSLHLWVLA